MSDALTPSDAVRKHVTTVVEELQRAYLPDAGVPPTSYGAATLAGLRKAQGSASTLDPRALSSILEGLPVELQSRDRGATQGLSLSRPEVAVHTALVTYAVHQQSEREGQHRRGVGLGSATRALARQRAAQKPSEAVGGLDERVVERFHRVSTAQTAELRMTALRALVTLMRAAEPSVFLDYGLLAQDVYWLQQPAHVHRVQLRWGRELHRTERHTADAPADSTTTDPAAHESEGTMS